MTPHNDKQKEEPKEERQMLRIEFPEGKTDEELLKMAEGWMEILDATEKLTGTEGTTDRSGLVKMITDLKEKLSK
jgi:hypothetical protein